MPKQFENSDVNAANGERKSAEGLTRRQLVVGGAAVAGLTTAIASGTAQANTQKPPGPASTINPNGRFAGKVVLITGATSGIGEGTAYAFAREGAKVFFCGRRENLGRQVEARIKGFGGESTYMQADVRREEDVKAFVDGCVQKYGRLDIAFNNAGIVNPNLAKLHEQSAADFLDTLNTNTTGVFYSLKHEIPHMLRQRGGCIVNTASVSGHRGFTEIGPYSVSKHALLGLTKVASLEYAKDNIRITSISPGGVDTPMLRRVREQRGMSFEEGSKAIPIGRTNTVEEMARAVMFLASDDATAFHGSLVDVTSGILD
ncbi:SDR family NAD(P)-dependent oxidoreductase [Leptolyngbya sp. FACHB-261]|uniref:SDR family NAD(P)-dependent oxidoreductase n=1 Tax=Leptolyngbya sp. FACHB-261 TaxID=2692806 RepID=UPI0016842A37|nr:SDR family oxidoreductase [Leptolyngbya sp. FACHB-261]MBD2104959.1 SDR family oxidoreductase [Leptolyngbya sp. FACHB-261]